MEKRKPVKRELVPDKYMSDGLLYVLWKLTRVDYSNPKQLFEFGFEYIQPYEWEHKDLAYKLFALSEQFGITGMAQLMEARAKGVPVVALAVIYRKNPLIWFSVNENITSAKDLIGKKVGVTVASNSDILFRAMLVKAGVDINNVEIVPVKYDISLLLTGTVDAYEGYLINQPLSARENGFKTYIINPTDYGINFYGDAIFATEDMIKKNPDLVRRFMNATLQGWEYAYSHPDEAVNYTLTYSDQLTRAHETAMMYPQQKLVF